MVEVGVIPERGTETSTQAVKGCEMQGKGFLKATTRFAICPERGVQQMLSICYVNLPKWGKAIKMCCKNCPGAGQAFAPGFSYC